jgi:hypothetical protein
MYYSNLIIELYEQIEFQKKNFFYFCFRFNVIFTVINCMGFSEHLRSTNELI